MSENIQDGESHSSHLEEGMIFFDKPRSTEEAARQRREHEQHEFARDQVETNRKIARFTRLLVFASFVGACIGIWQAGIAGKSARAALSSVLITQTEQRAWVEVSLAPQTTKPRKPFKLVPGQPISVPLYIQNIGNTVASKINLCANATLQERSKTLDIGWIGDRHLHQLNLIGTGLLFPREGYTGQLKSSVGSVITSNDTIDFALARKYVAVYGRVYYTDVFHCVHWTQFCLPIRTDKSGYAPEDCVEANSEGDAKDEPAPGDCTGMQTHMLR